MRVMAGWGCRYDKQGVPVVCVWGCSTVRNGCHLCTVQRRTRTGSTSKKRKGVRESLKDREGQGWPG